jgi:RNA polymerase sigma-70 factor (sigma-E family)
VDAASSKRSVTGAARWGDRTSLRHEDDFVEFAAASREWLRRTAYVLCGDWHRASDITQEALIRVYVAWPRLENKGGLAAYARRAVVSVVIDQSRQRSSTEVPAMAAEAAPVAPDLAGEVADRQAVRQALARLPQRRRACVVLRYFEELSVAEVAALLGISEGTVKSQTSRGLASLRTMLEDEAHDAPVVADEAGRGLPLFELPAVC